MTRVILITGATDGIGLETARMLAADGHTLLLHGRNTGKIQTVSAELSKLTTVYHYTADLSDLSNVKKLAEEVKQNHQTLDVLVNNAGVLRVPNSVLPNGQDIRFVVNTIAPYVLTKMLLPLMDANGRVINLSSAAQAPVSLSALKGNGQEMDAMDAYSQSKLAITMWSRAMAATLGSDGPAIIALNPGSLLASKMVKEGFGIPGNDLSIGAEILVQAALADEFSDASGKYFDNDSGRFNNPHDDAMDMEKCVTIVETIERVIS